MEVQSTSVHTVHDCMYTFANTNQVHENIQHRAEVGNKEYRKPLGPCI
jgi:hypothetical protein